MDNHSVSSICAMCRRALRKYQIFLRCNGFEYPGVLRRFDRTPEVLTMKHHNNLQSFLTSVLEGCHICKKVSLADEEFENKWNDRSRLICSLYMFSVPYRTMERSNSVPVLPDFYMDFVIKNPTELGLDQKISFEFVGVEPKQDVMKVSGYKRTTRLDDSASLALAKHWINQCGKDHSCTNLQNGEIFDEARSWRPHRLLYIHNNLKIVQGTSIPEGVVYATLSHCWGTVKYRNNFTTANEFQWKQHLPIEDLMPTFVDAVKIARELGFHYIWIDSLCILQDSERDWQIQAPKMAEIYKYSKLNIAATAAKSDNEGFLHERDINYIATRVHIEGPQSSLSEKYYPSINWGDFDVYFLGYAELITQSMWHQPLPNRGWIVQERILAPRTIHFTHTQLYWECDDMIALESHPSGLYHGRFQFVDTYSDWPVAMIKASSINQHMKILREKQRDQLSSRAMPDIASLHKSWETIVWLYSTTEITFERDRLIAISAIAKEMRRLTGWRYVAGLWEHGLARQLNWKTPKSRESRRYSTYCGPSWSWVSVHGLIEFPVLVDGHDFVPLIYIEDIKIQTIDGVEDGEMIGAELLLTGCIHRISWKSGGWMDTIISPTIGGYLKDKSMFFDMEAESDDFKFNNTYEIDSLVTGIQWSGTDVDIHLIMVRYIPGSGTYQRVGQYTISYGDEAYKDLFDEGYPIFGSDSFSASLGTVSYCGPESQNRSIVMSEEAMVRLTLI